MNPAIASVLSLASLRRALCAAAVASTCCAIAPSAHSADTPDFSPAERALFMEDQFGAVKAPATLRYAYHKAGSFEPGFDDTVALALTPQPDGSCCAVAGQFLSGERSLRLPDVEAARGNPVTMYFLERDIHEMQRLTKGQPNHFRRQIRLAIYEGASVRDVSLRFHGKAVAGREIVISPYLTDPNRPRFEKFAAKQYVFTLSNAVPGGVYAIRTQVPDPSGGAAPPLLSEEMTLDGAEPAAH